VFSKNFFRVIEKGLSAELLPLIFLCFSLPHQEMLDHYKDLKISVTSISKLAREKKPDNLLEMELEETV